MTLATPTLSVTNSPVVYNGSAQAAVVSGSVTGVVSAVKYDGSATVPTNAATYAVTADFVPTDTTNYNSLTASSAGNFVISKATPTLSVTNSPVTYDGAAKSAAVSASVAGTVSNVLTGGAATKTDAGTYAVTANFVLKPDLSIAKTHSDTPAWKQGDTGKTYTITVTNNTANAVDETYDTITVTDTLPAGLTYVSGTGTGWSCSATRHPRGIPTSPASGPIMWAPTTRWLAVSTTSFMKMRSWFAPSVCLSERNAVL